MPEGRSVGRDGGEEWTRESRRERSLRKAIRGVEGRCVG